VTAQLGIKMYIEWVLSHGVHQESLLEIAPEADVAHVFHISAPYPECPTKFFRMHFPLVSRYL
jgi:hypothetical protein